MIATIYQGSSGFISSVCKLLLLLVLACMPLSAQNTEKTAWDDIWTGITSSFDIPLGNLYNKDSSDIINVGASFIAPLQRAYPSNEYGMDRNGRQATNYALTAGVSYVPIGYWFFSLTAYKYLDNAYKAPWHPDFSYRFGYDDWHPYTLSLVYANYGGNRFYPDRGKNEKVTRFEEGSFTLGWKFPLPHFVAEYFLIDWRETINHSINLSVVPSYSHYESQNIRKWKKTLSFNTNYPIYKWWYLNFNVYYYPDITERQPWDPDFTYGFGYFDWHSNTLSVQYNNYSGNRFPWSRRTPPTGKFLDGSLSLMYQVRL